MKNHGHARDKRRGIFKHYHKDQWDKGLLPCCWCGELLTYNKSTLEHLVPKLFKGSNDRRNLDIACYSCNNLRGNILSKVHAGIISHVEAGSQFTNYLNNKKKNILTLEDLNVC